MQRNRHIGGVIPAVVLPRNPDGEPLWPNFDANLAFLVERGVSGVCVNGATGEYASATAAERREAVRRARIHVGDDLVVVGAIGAADWRDCLHHAEDAANEGADILLVPVPHFFPYQQEDVAEFYERLGESVRLPVLIYNLPQFAGGVDTDVAIDLICEKRSVAGIKDSSGSLDILRALTARPDVESIRLLGNDAVLAEAILGGLCQGVISGVACVLPELITGLYAAAAQVPAFPFRQLAIHLDEFIDQLNVLPVPWGLKVVAECRGLAPATYSMPLTANRRSQIQAFENWFAAWWPAVSELAQSARAASAITPNPKSL
jgi:4-hydroxy-tetrahydrodipicolinate synthase